MSELETINTNGMTGLFIRPVDVWLFRDGKPFNALDDRRAESMFPPYPSVMQGALRSNQLARLGVDLNDKRAIAEAVGTSDDFKDLLIRGPFVARMQAGVLTRYFPAPADACMVDAVNRRIRPASPPQVLGDAMRSCLPDGFLALGMGDEPEKREGALWLDERSLAKYLKGETVACVQPEKTDTKGRLLFQRETRPGIALDSGAKSALEGALFEVDFIRPDSGMGLALEVSGCGVEGWPDEGLLKLGGDQRAGCYQKMDPPPWQAPVASQGQELPPRFKLYFASPACFEGGWLPGDWGQFFEGKVALRCAALERFESVGGFDYAKGAHKPARRFVPAGSVYYFECSGPARLKQPAVSEYGAQIGFGTVILEEW